ncbi:MAG: hypothetical protein OES20_11765 [Gammaproteobacteria bacterium]|nr:hypothetical protein [Gammaproteobacteria bacterium]
MPSSKRFHGWTNRRLRRLGASFAGYFPWRRSERYPLDRERLPGGDLDVDGAIMDLHREGFQVDANRGA